MNYQITGLNRANFVGLFGLSDAELAARSILRLTAEKSATARFPCRISLRDADAGESVLLLNFEHLPVASPYQSRHAIYIRENANDAKLAINEIPEIMLNRPLSIRAFDHAGMLVDADLAMGDNLAPTLERLIAGRGAAYLHVHNAKHGCFVARVDRA